MKKKLPTLCKRLFMISKYLLFGTLLQCLLLNLLSAKDGSAQNVYDVPVQIKANEKSVKEIFALIEEKTDFSFTYSEKKIDVTRRVSLEGNEANLGRVLEKISAATSLTFRQTNKVLMVRQGAAKITLENGTISGKVIDDQLNDALPGANIRVVGTNIITVSDLNGAFSLRAPAGSIELETTYIGFKKAVQAVEVIGNGAVDIEVRLVSDMQQLDNIVVTGVLQGQQRALNQQKAADNIKNIVSADQIGRFPDPNVAEALQRVPAVNIERDQGEGRYVLVRGLAPQFTNISINGEQVPSPEAGVRYVALDAVPADQLSSIEVSKSLTPDMDGDAIGGSVNLITRTAQTDPSIKATSVLGYNQIVGRSNFQGSLELGKRFFGDQLGIMINSSYYESDRGSDNWERDGNDMEIRDYDLVRTRLGVSGTIDYKFDGRNEIYFRSIYNRFTDRELRRRYILIPNADNSPFENNEIERFTKDRLEKQTVSSFNLGGKHTFSKLNLDYEVAYAEAVQDTPFDIEIGSVGEFDDIQIDFTSNKEFPTFTVNGLANLNPANAYLDNRNYEFDEFVNGKTYALDVNKTAKFNIGLPYKIGDNEGLIKFGAKGRLKEKSYTITENVFGWAGGDVTFPGMEAGDYTLEKFAGGTVDDNFLKGKYLLRANADPEKVINHFNNNLSGYELDVEGKLATEAVEAYSATEDVYAAYAMAKIQMQKLMLLGGVRYEKTNVSYQSKEVLYDFEGNLDEIRPVSGKTDYGFLLPQLHAKYAVNNSTNLRFAITKSYARPNFQDIVPAQEIELNAREGSIGNPALKPVSAINMDLLGEKYFGTVGILSGGFFYKRLSDFIFNRRSVTDNYPGAEGVELQLTQAQNGEAASVSGVELAYQQNLSFLPGALKGLSVYANYTFTNSNATIQSRVNENSAEDIRLPGQAKHVGNFSLGYDVGRFNLRWSTNFNGEYMTEVGGDASEDLFVKDRIQMDATATVTINQRLRFFAEFLNITNQPFEVYQGEEDRYIQREFYSWWTRVGLKFDF